MNCTYYIVDREFGDDEFLPLGKACDIKEVIVLDEEGHLITPDQTGNPGSFVSAVRHCREATGTTMR